MSNSRSSQPAERLAVARITGVHGLKGGLRLELLTDWPEDLAVGETVQFDGDDQERAIASLVLAGRTPVVLIEGVESREGAEAVVGRFLEVPARELPAGSYWWHQLEGLTVEDERGTPVGTLVEVFRAGANEVYRVVGPAGERLVPALRDAVASIDLEAGRMVIRDETSYVADA